MKKLLIIFFALSFFSSCVAVKEYEMVNLSDPDMALSTKKTHKSKTTFQSYREAASGASGGKSGGGCGCN